MDQNQMCDWLDISAAMTIYSFFIFSFNPFRQSHMYDECVGDAQSRECIDILYASKVLDWFRNQTKYRHNQYWFSHQTLQKLYHFFVETFLFP